MYDLAVIGGGPGGYTAAIAAAQRGLRTLLVERDRVGGTCLNRGCIPTKSFLWDVALMERVRSSTVLAGKEGVSLDVGKMVRRKEKVVNKLVQGLTRTIRSHGIDLIEARAELTGPRTIEVADTTGSKRRYEARHLILATGSRPSTPPGLEPDGELVVTSDKGLKLAPVPKSLAVVGGGVIGVEFAVIYRALGARVTILEALPDILCQEDEEVREALRNRLNQRSIEIHAGAEVTGLQIQESGCRLEFLDKEGRLQLLSAEKVLVATGRSPDMDGIDPARLGLSTEGGFIRVNRWMETDVPGIYAIGDLTGGWMLAHAAMAEAEAAVEHILGGRAEFRPETVPRCIWGIPEAAAVGLSEKEARERGRDVKIGRFPLMFSGKAHIMDDPSGFVKIVADRQSGEILGVHIVGEGAAELIGEFLLAIKMEAAVEDLGRVVKIHPSLSEASREAALAWEERAIHLPKIRRHPRSFGT